ncbi:hypothetical protein Aperf_G00000096397 [Anoplocephala perfoliata]
MAKVKLQVPRQLKNMKGVKKNRNMKSKLNSRERVLMKQLKEVGKVGGVIDKRIGSEGSSIFSSDAAIRRHIIEKLRQMETLSTMSVDNDDPLIKAALGDMKPGKQASYDDELGGLSADIVESELFAGGVLTTPEASNAANKQNKHDILLEKIAQTREDRLKRVEENEATRQKLKDANTEWTDKIRFMLSELGNLKPKNPKAAEKMEKNRSEIFALLSNLSSEKRIAPIGARVETEATKNSKLLANLESIVAKRAGEVDTTEAKEDSRTEDFILRLLCQIDAYSPTMVARIAGELQALVLNQLSDALRGLLLTQILFTDVIHRKLELTKDQANPQVKKFAGRNRLTGIFVPEAVRFLIRLIKTATREDGILFINGDVSSTDESAYATLDIRVALRQRPVKDSEILAYQLGCLDRCLSLSYSFLELFSEHFPAPAVCSMFSGLDLTDLKADYLPVGIGAKAQRLVQKFSEVKARPRPNDIITVDKISMVLADKNATPQALQKVGLVPQLEPDFEERLSTRRPKKKATHVELRQKLAKERRGIVRELRKDARFLTNYDRQKTKANDEMRKKKTQAIIASIRSID